MYKNLSIAALLGLIAVVLGAFGAHKLKEILTPEALESFETAVRYQIFHVIVLLFVNTYQEFSGKQKQLISIFFFVGILFFSGSIYLMYLAGVPASSIWFITPLGGLLLIIGWALIFANFLKKAINNK